MNNEQEEQVTKSGYKYVLDSNNNKIRDCLQNRRLDEDDETHEEYKARQKVIKNYDKRKKQGQFLWTSRNYYDKRKMNPKGDAEEYMKRNLGTYNKETVRRIMEEEQQKENTKDQGQ